MWGTGCAIRHRGKDQFTKTFAHVVVHERGRIRSSSHPWLPFEPDRCHTNRRCSPGCKLAKGFLDDVAVLRLGANTGGARVFNAGTLHLVNGSVRVVRTVWRMVKEHTLLTSRHTDRGEGRGTSSEKLNGLTLRLRFSPDLGPIQCVL